MKDDLTERRRTGEIFDRYAAIVKSSDDPIIETDLNGTVLSWNPAAGRIYGYSANEMIGKPISILAPPDHPDEIPGILEQLRRNELVKNFENVRVRKDGQRINVSLSIFPVRGSYGEISGFCTITRDITERKRAEEARVCLAAAIEQAAETIVITDADGTIQYVNPAFEKLSGYSREEAIGKNPRILKSGRQDQDFYRAMWDTLTRGEVWTGNFINKRKDGKIYEEVAVISPVRDASGKIVNYVAVKRDVTHEMQMEAQIRQAQKMEAVGKLTGGIAHDFNNLLTAILGYSEILLSRVSDVDPSRRDIEEIKHAAERAAAMTRQLLAFSRKQILKPRILSLNEVVLHTEKMLRRLIGEHIEFTVFAADDLWRVKVDPGQIEQVIMNLVVNSKDAMPEGGKLTIETSNAELDDSYVRDHPYVKPGPYVMLAVSDSGCGIDAETQSHIFEPFFTTKEQGKGTGLGLSTVYGIVKQSSGYIFVFSDPGKGTAFKVFLPRVEEIPDQGSPPEEILTKIKSTKVMGSETILISEDEGSVRELVQTVLENQGYKVLVAQDGTEALEVSCRYDGPIHLLITDLVMPQIGGQELAKRLAQSRPGIKTLFMSGYTEDAVVHHGILESGGTFIQKPFRLGVLERKVREVLDSPPKMIQGMM
jgi:two-component system, cell cycle sensor histidine kinase and response regulator CckA